MAVQFPGSLDDSDSLWSVSNLAESTLFNAIVTTGSISTIDVVDGDSFPDGRTTITIEDEIFIVKKQAPGGDVFDVESRAAGGTVAATHVAGSIVCGNFVAQQFEDIRDAIIAVETYIDNLSPDHGDLTGLGDDDHTQYLLVDGSRAMTGNLNLATFNLLTSGTVDGRDVSTDGTNQDNHIGDGTIHFTEASISIPASQISDFDTEVSNNSSVAANTAKNTNVSTDLSIGTVTSTTVDIDSSDGTNATIPEATATDAGLLSVAKRAEIIANTAKNTNVSTDLSIGTTTSTTVDINSSDGTNATIPEATATDAGLLSVAKRAEIIANTAKNTNVSTDLSIGTTTSTTVDIDSSDGTNATIPETTATDAGLLSVAKRAEIIANTAKNTNVSTNLSIGTITSTTVDINSSDGTNATIPEATATDAGLLSAANQVLIGSIAEADIFDMIWAEENAALANGQREWSFGNGSTGVNNVTMMYSGLIKKAFIEAETPGTTATIDIMVNDVVAGTASFSANGLYVFPSPIAISEGDAIGFRTNTVVGTWTDVRVGVGIAQTVSGLVGAQGPAGASTDLSIGTVTGTTLDINSSSGLNATIPAFTGTDAGLVPASGGGATDFLREDGTWQTVSASGELNPDLVSQAEAEAGTSNTERVWSALRNKQAFDAYPKEKTRIYKRHCGGSGDQTINSDEVVEIDGDTEDLSDTAIVTFASNEFTLKKTGGIYKIYYVLNCVGSGSVFGGAEVAKAEFERNNNGAGWNDVDSSYATHTWWRNEGTTEREFTLHGTMEITDSVADQTLIRLTAQDETGQDWEIYKQYSKVVIEWTGDE